MIENTSNYSYIQLPRNFQFISRLPARFKMIVLSSGNQTGSGQWFEVNIEGHTLNILSKTSLVVSQKYIVEKSSPLSLKVISESEVVEKITENEESPIVEIKINEVVVDKPSQNQESWASSLADFLTSIVIYDEKEEKNISYKSDSPNRVSFEFSLPNSLKKIKGLVHKKESSNNTVYLHIDETPMTDEAFSEELKLFLVGLNVSQVSLISKDMYERLALGINTIS